MVKEEHIGKDVVAIEGHEEFNKGEKRDFSLTLEMVFQQIFSTIFLRE
jgi:hypothetical protein